MQKNFKCWPEQWPRSLHYPEIPVYTILEQTARRVPNRVAMIFLGMELTYEELKLLSDRFAAALVSLGVQKGDRVAIHLPNCPQFAIAYYATMKIGAVFTPLSPLLKPQEASHQLNDSGATTLISLDLIFPTVKDVLPSTAIRRVITTSLADCQSPLIKAARPLPSAKTGDTFDMYQLLADNEPLRDTATIDVHNDLAHLAYTGGTTGVSKGVMLSHYNVVVNVIQYSCWASGASVEWSDGVLRTKYPSGVDPVRDRVSAPDNETALVVVPWFHAMGTVGYLNCQVFSGTTMVVFPRFDPQQYLDAIVKYRATMLGGAPQLYIPLLNHPEFWTRDLSTVKLAASGAAPLARSILDRLLEAFPKGVVLEAYGLTECTMGATSNPPGRQWIRPGSVGLPVFDTECRVVDPATGQDLPPGKEGEICIRGPQVMKGYWNRPKETQEVLRDGWLYTGDIGMVDEDGFFYITDRKKDMIIYKGYNVYPREIEEVLFRHPAVEQCAVVGKGDQDGGEIPVAFVQLKKGMQATKEELLEHTNSRIAHYKKIREVIFLDSIPVSEAGKVLKKELRKMLQ